MTRHFRAFALGMLCVFGAATPVLSQDYPSRPIKIIVPFAAGAATDVVARLIAERTSKELGQPMVIENIAGANGVLAAQATMRSNADGYTLLFGSASTHGLNQAMTKSLPYDAVKDFAPVTKIADSMFVLAVHPSVPANNVKELVAYGKSNPGKLTIGSGSGGSLLSGEMFRVQNGIETISVPYKGLPLAMNDLISGQIAMSFTDLVSTIPHRNAGKVKFFAVTGLKRSALVPEVPTMGEAGVEDVNVTAWIACFAPAKTPRAVVEKLNKAFAIALKDPVVVKRLFDLSLEARPTSPEELGAFVVEEIKRAKDMVAAAGIEVK